MQAAVIEFARNVCHIEDANSSELVKTNNAVIDLIRGKDKTEDIGGTLRLGNYKTTLVPNTLAHQLYGKDEVLERHRHRYEVNNDYRQQLEQAGLVFSGLYETKTWLKLLNYVIIRFILLRNIILSLLHGQTNQTHYLMVLSKR